MGRFGDVELDDLELSGARLTLRRWRADDADRVLEVMADRSMWEFLALPDPYTRQAAHGFVTDLGHEGRADGTGLGCAVVERASGRVVGSAALRLSAGTTPDSSSAEIGYWIAPDARGRGYAAEVCRELASFGFDRLHLHRIAILTDVRNLASARTALNAGFRFEGRVRDAAPVCGAGVGDLAWFGRLGDDPAGPVSPSLPPLPPGGLRDDRIALRVLTTDDAEELTETENDRVSVDVGFDGVPTPSSVLRRLADRSGLDWLVGPVGNLALVDHATGAFAGLLTLRLTGPPGVVALGYAVHPLFRGRGYTSRALRSFAPWAFANGFHRLELGAKTSNVASQRAALSAGFVPDGVREARLRNPDGTVADEVRFVLLRA